MSDPTQEATMTPTGPVSDAMVDVAFSTWMSHDGTALCRMRLAIEAALIAVAANAPTTPAPDGLAGRVKELEKRLGVEREATFGAWDHLSDQVIAHDAALEELRERVDQFERWIHMLAYGLMDTLERNDDYPSDYAKSLSRIAYDEDHLGQSDTPPDVPDAGEDDLDNLEDQINEACREITRERTTKVRLTTAPPPLVVTDGLIAYVASRHIIDSRWIKLILESAVEGWNATRVPAGDGQDDTPDVGGE